MKRILLIIGFAPCCRADMVEAIVLVGPEYDQMCIGLDVAVRFSGPFEYVATYHRKDVPLIREIHPAATIISHKPGPGVQIVQERTTPTGSSALLGTLAALDLGYTKIILCGCPLIGKNKFGRDYNKQFSYGWKVKKNIIAPYVRSMSGWTRELLGEPTKGWLIDEGDA